ncbi:MAG: cation-translocating P-type ATPase, partial [Candidatus Riflebacteria bacterium]|nr:cation-translocating P-type ATPase [Candidatus Riflebacteria bacterium]
IQRIADKWASWLVPVALIIAILAYLATGNIVRAVTVLVVFCPCALVLSTPTAIMAAIGQATKYGIIIKNGETLELMGSVNTIAFDKTGTFTFGKLEVSDIFTAKNIAETDLLQITSSLESKSEHPLAKAISQKANLEKITIKNITDFKMTAGKGISAIIDNKKYYCGKEKYILENNISLEKDALDFLDTLRSQGKASVIVADSDKIIGVIGLSDTLKPNAKEMVSELEKMNTKSVLLTGDNKKAAEFFAEKIGLKELYSDLLPSEKVDYVEKLKESGKVCMVGDGVNDAPALKIADVGVAMGGIGSDISVEAADVALMTDDISKISYLKWLSNETVKTIKTAITLSMTINFIAIILSVTGVLTPTTGALVHNAGSCFVVLLAARLYDKKYK